MVQVLLNILLPTYHSLIIQIYRNQITSKVIFRVYFNSDRDDGTEHQYFYKIT